MANIELLQHLVTVMERVKLLQLPFEWASFFDHYYQNPLNKPSITDFSDILNPQVITGPPEGFCHTSACVLGWAAADKKFNELGLFVDKGCAMTADDRELWAVRFGEFSQGNAGRKFFDLTLDEAGYLFFGKGDIDEAIRRVRRLAAGERLTTDEIARIRTRCSHAIGIMIDNDETLTYQEKRQLCTEHRC